MPANVQSMAYYGEEPWHGLGTPVPEGATAAEMIHAAGLDWAVRLRPARGAEPINQRGEYSRYEVLRVPRANSEETEVLFGVVSRLYRPLQNVEAFEFFDPIVAEGRANFETAGALGQGERIWVMARTPGSMEIVRGDECYKYLLLSNTHTGNGSVTVKFTSVRVVCQNTLMLAMQDGHKAHRVRHSGMMPFRLSELGEFLEITQRVFQEAEELFRQLAMIQMTGDRLGQYLEAVFPRTKAQQRAGKQPPRWHFVKKVFESRPDLQIPGVQGTLWGAYNAVTRFEDYKQPVRGEKSDQKLERAWFGSGAETKLKALEKAKEMAEQWR